MSRKITVALLSVCALVWAYTLDDPGPMRYEKLDETRSVVYVQDGTPVGEIVAAKGAGPKFAAEELQQFIERSTGAKLPIVSALTGGKPAFMVGIAPDGFDVATLPRDGFIIRTVGDNTYIVGQDEVQYSPVSRPLYRDTTTSAVPCSASMASWNASWGRVWFCRYPNANMCVQ